MKEVYEKLLENLASITPEEKEKEWEELKKYNNIGPSVIKVIKFDEAWLITLFIWLLSLELIVIISIALIKFYDFLCKHIKAKQKNS